MSENSESRKLQIAMFPWLAFGHMIPWLRLAKLIAQKGHKVIFISTPRNIDRLPKLSPNLLSFIHFVKLPLPHVDNLRENAEATIDLPYDEVWYLKKAYDCLQQPIKNLLHSLSPDWLLYDFTAYWLPPIARQLCIRHGLFSTYTAATLGYIGPSSALINGAGFDLNTPEDYTKTPKWVSFPTTVAFRLFEARKVFRAITGDESNVSDFYRFGESLRSCEIIVIRSCMEFEPEWIKVVEEIHHKPVIPVGQLPTTDDDCDETDTWRLIKEWLDEQPRCSILYVAFGSEVKLNQEELNKLALGLELSGLPFFWVLKKRIGEADTELIELPDGFEERTKGRGVVCTSWAPQRKILAHDSIGGFLTHSGWNSVVEALQFGRALVLLTFYADQGLNAKHLEEKKIGYLIPRDEGDGSFTRTSVAESLRLVLEEEEGRIYRDKAMEMRGLFGDRDSQDYYVDNFLSYLKSCKCVNK